MSFLSSRTFRVTQRNCLQKKKPNKKTLKKTKTIENCWVVNGKCKEFQSY